MESRTSIVAIPEMFIEYFHELHCGLVTNCPEWRQNRAGTRSQESPCQTNHAFGRNFPSTTVTRAKHDKSCSKLQSFDIWHFQHVVFLLRFPVLPWRIWGQTNVTCLRASMRGDVDQSDRSNTFQYFVFSRFLSDEWCGVDDFSNHLHFLFSVRQWLKPRFSKEICYLLETWITHKQRTTLTMVVFRTIFD